MSGGARLLCRRAVVVAVFASVAGLRRRVARDRAVAGLAQGLAFAASLAIGDPKTTEAVAILATTAALTLGQRR